MDNRELNIINRFLHGDHEAYSLLYRDHIQELFSYGKALTGNDERLKDAIQDVFYKLLSNPAALKDVQNLKYFLFKSLKNRLIDILKSEMRQSQSGEAAAYEQIDFTINDVTVLDSLIEEVQSPNQKIPDRKTKCVIKTHINIKQNVIFGAKLKPV